MKTYLVIGFDKSDGVSIWLKIKAPDPSTASKTFIKQCKKELGPDSKYFVEFVIGPRLEVHYNDKYH